jgi:hypothetical protein
VHVLKAVQGALELGYVVVVRQPRPFDLRSQVGKVGQELV